MCFKMYAPTCVGSFFVAITEYHDWVLYEEKKFIWLIVLGAGSLRPGGLIQ